MPRQPMIINAKEVSNSKENIPLYPPSPIRLIAPALSEGAKEGIKWTKANSKVPDTSNVSDYSSKGYVRDSSIAH